MNIIEKFAERVAGTLLAIMTAVYISGFVIVNTYLSRFHIAQIELFQPAFISAGLFFSLMACTTAVLVWPVAKWITILAFPIDSQIQQPDANVQQRQTANATGQSGNPDSVRNFGLIALIISLIVGSCILEGVIGYLLMFCIIKWASAQNVNQGLVILLAKIAGLQGLAAISVFLLIQNWKRLRKLIRDGAVALSVIIFLLVHSYSLLMIAKYGYELLPNNIGGGQPGYVKFYVTQKNARYLAALDNSFSNRVAIIPQNYDTKADLVVTNRLTLFWQIKSVGLRGNDGEEIYFVRPTTCGDCPLIKLYSSNIYAVAYDQLPSP